MANGPHSAEYTEQAIKRQEFLAKHWQSYPSVQGWNLGEYIFGTIESLTHQELTLKTSVGQELQKIAYNSLHQDPSSSDSEFSCLEVLLAGDRVAVHWTTGVVTLLAPKLGQFERSSEQKELYLKWCLFLQNVRAFFINRGFVETPTPLLVPSPGTEPFLQPFTSEFKSGRLVKKMFLPTSPELHLKKILGLGFTKVFEINRSFRNGEITDFHQPEFYMLEWYRAYSDLSVIKNDLIQLLNFLSHDPVRFSQKSIAELFYEKLQFVLTPSTTREELVQLALRLDLASSARLKDFSWDEVFHLIFLEKIEHQWGTEQALFIEGYPPSQAAFARLDDGGWAQRFELYWKGMELANAFHEVNDPKIQSERFAHDLQIKQQNNFTTVDLDIEFNEMLKTGMPPSGGIALGLDRLFMALYDLKSIQGFQLFAWPKDLT